MTQSDYEIKFIRFYKKFICDGDNAKTKLATYGDDLEYAYSLSKSISDEYSEVKVKWKEIWDKLTEKEPFNENDPIRSQIKNSLSGKHKKTIEPYLIFFHVEYLRVIKKLGKRLNQ